MESAVIASWLLKPEAEAPCSVGTWDKIWSGRLATDGDAGGTAAAALWWLSDMSFAISDWGGSKVGKGQRRVEVQEQEELRQGLLPLGYA